MKYVVIDVETTGLDAENNEILSIGAIVEDTLTKLPYDKLPKFHAAIRHKEVKGSLFALNMNRELIGNIIKYETSKTEAEKSVIEKESGMIFLEKERAAEELFCWMIDSGLEREYLDQEPNHRKRITGLKTKSVVFTAAGKNFATFDKKFLEALPSWHRCFRIRQRTIDPAILYVDWKKDDILPSLEECMKRAELGINVSHNALNDAWDTLGVLRKFY